MKLSLYLLPLLLLVNTSKVMAQIPLNPSNETSPEIETLPSLEDILPRINSPDFPASITDIPEEITVTKFEIKGNTIFSEDELNAILTGFIDRPISFADLMQVQETITEYYVSKGYISSGAFIPPQPLNKGVITIEIIEGAIEDIKITGLQHLNAHYVRSRINLAGGKPLNQDTLFTGLQLLLLNPLIDKLNVELATGTRPGYTIINVKITEADPFSVTFNFDNQRNPVVGTIRGGIELNHLNLTGNGDELNVKYSHTEGSDSLDGFRYTLPINSRNGTISFNHGRTSSNIIEKPFDQLNIYSKYLSYELTYRQPIIETPGEEFILGISGTKEESRGKLNGIKYPLSTSANDEGETEISAVRFFTEYLNRDKYQVLAIRSELGLGIDALGATVYDSNRADSEFLNWRTSAQYFKKITPDTSIVFRGFLQLANDSLPPLEQFSVGGQFSVRGYRQDELLSDNGFLASAEIRTPILKIPEWDTVLELSPFFDFATIWNDSQSEFPLDKKTISSVGLGLTLNVGTNFQARLDWGIPLVDIPQRGNSLQENGLYFQVRYSPF